MSEQPQEVTFSNEALLELEVLTLDRQLFEQIEVPKGIEEAQAQEARESGFALVVEIPERSPVSLVWLLVKGKPRLWRWNVCFGYELEQAVSEYPWLEALPQVFLA